MLIDEEAAKLRFCPFGRGAFPIPDGQGKPSGKYVDGVNMAPNGPLTTCEGTRCMLWETNQVISQPTACPACEKKPSEDCGLCGGKGTYTKQHVIGFCGAGHNGPAVAAINDLKQALLQQTVVYAKGLGVDLKELFKKPEPAAPQAPGNSEDKPS